MTCPCCLTATGCKCCPRGTIPTEILCQIDYSITGFPLCCETGNFEIPPGTPGFPNGLPEFRTTLVDRQFSQQVIMSRLGVGSIQCVSYSALVPTGDPGGEGETAVQALVFYQVRIQNFGTANEYCERRFVMELQLGCTALLGWGYGSSELTGSDVLQQFEYPTDPIEGFCYVPFSATDAGTRLISKPPFCVGGNNTPYSVDYDYSCEAIDWS